MNPPVVFGAAALALALLGILWRFSSTLTRLDLAIDALVKVLEGDKATPGVVQRVSALEKRVTELETGDAVDAAVRARDERSMQRRGVRATEHQYVDPEHLAKRKGRKR